MKLGRGDSLLIFDSVLGLRPPEPWGLWLSIIFTPLLRLSAATPPPEMNTGSIRSRRKPSVSNSLLLELLPFRLDALRLLLPVALLALVLRAQLPLALVVLPLRPLIEYFPYPSYPVPAVGPFLVGFSCFPDGNGSGLGFGRLENIPNRGALVDLP